MKARKSSTYVLLWDTGGFTLIEMVIVIVVVSILFLIVTPRITRVINSERNSFAILAGMIAKTFDDSFLHNRINYLVVQLQNPNPDEAELSKDISGRQNAVSVLSYVNRSFVENKRKSLQAREFPPDKFLIEEVLLANGEKLTSGYVLIPFYPQGYSDNVILHILVNGEVRRSIKIDKNIKEPEVLEGYATFESENE
jgi:prepilin-type N-terminal cleavage/methylation domain-containing protein